MPKPFQPYTAVTVTATTTKQLLINLVKAINADAPSAAREVRIQVDPVDGTDYVAIGDASISASQRGNRLAVGQSVTYRGDGAQNVYLNNIYLLAASGSQTVNVEIMR